MTFAEAIKAHRQRNLLPEEQVIVAIAATYPCVGETNYLDRALYRALMLDECDTVADADYPAQWQQEIAMLELATTLAREIVESRVALADIDALLADLREKLGEARKIAEVVA